MWTWVALLVVEGLLPVAGVYLTRGLVNSLAARDAAWDWRRVAVIAREWRYLQPVRTWCELNDVPAQMADEAIPNFWRLRETQALVAWVRGSFSGLIDVLGVRAYIASRDGSPWWDLLAEAFEGYALEVGQADMPVQHFLEWLAEWGREARRRRSKKQGLVAVPQGV